MHFLSMHKCYITHENKELSVKVLHCVCKYFVSLFFKTNLNYLYCGFWRFIQLFWMFSFCWLAAGVIFIWTLLCTSTPDMNGRATVRVRQKYWPKLQVPEISRETFLKILSPNLQFKRCAHALDKLVNFSTFTNKISPWSVWGMSVLIIMEIVTRI